MRRGTPGRRIEDQQTNDFEKECGGSSGFGGREGERRETRATGLAVVAAAGVVSKGRGRRGQVQ